MDIKIEKNHLSRIKVYLIVLLFAMSLTMNVFFCSTYNPYEFSDKTTAMETWTISENIVANEGSDNTTYDSPHETIAKNTSMVLMLAAILKGVSRLLFLVIVFLFFFLTLFILLPDGCTLINQKVRLDN